MKWLCLKSRTSAVFSRRDIDSSHPEAITGSSVIHLTPTMPRSRFDKILGRRSGFMFTGRALPPRSYSSESLHLRTFVLTVHHVIRFTTLMSCGRRFPSITLSSSSRISIGKHKERAVDRC